MFDNIKFDVPLSIPEIFEILFADSSSVSNFIIGVPAHTDDSNKTFTPFSFAHAKISSP